jgi:hypothetical protein
MVKRPQGRPRKFEQGAQVFSLRLPTSLHAAIRAYVDDKGLSTNAVLLAAVQRWWESLPEHHEYDEAAKRPTGPTKRGKP